jgi:hypothetical protein
MTNPNPEDQPIPDASAASASAIRIVANVLGVLAGALFLTAFGIGAARHGEGSLLFLALGLLFLFFPLAVNRFVRADR